MRKTLNTTAISAFLTLSTTISSYASVGTSAGLTLLEAPSARASSLGEAFTAVSDDIAGLGYNPSSLSTLKSAQASFLFQKGLFEDSYGQFMIGSPSSRGGLGLSIGFYDGGDLEILNGSNVETVSAQQDITLGLSFSRKIRSSSIGISGKYISSELAETAKATAYAMDLGFNMPVTSKVQVGAAVQNLGSKLTFIETGDNLPRMARLGASFMMFPKSFATNLMLDGVYRLNEKDWSPAVGLETWMGPLALRAGYKGGGDLEKFSIGTGFILGPSSLDYSMGLVNKLDPRHQVSLSFRFNGVPMFNTPIVRKPEINKPERVAVKKQKVKEEKVPEEKASSAKDEENDRMAVEINQEPASRKHTLGSLESPSFSKLMSRRIYVVKEGDTLPSIAEEMYGKPEMWRSIYNANRHLIDDPENITVGQKILLP